MGVWGCHRGWAEVGRADGTTGDGPRWVGTMGDGPRWVGPRWVRPTGNGPTGAITGTHHYRMTSRMPSSARRFSNIYVFCAL